LDFTPEFVIFGGGTGFWHRLTFRQSRRFGSGEFPTRAQITRND
jgi:hypothetical protein